MTKKSLCCGADVRELYRATVNGLPYRCLSCDSFCDLQKNEDLTLAEVYAVKDDVINFKDQGNLNDKYFDQADFDHAWHHDFWCSCRYTITDRKSWHKYEKKEVKIGDKLTGEQATKYLKAGGFVDHNNIVIYRLNKQKNKLEFFRNNHNCWLPDSGDRDCFKADSARYTAVENPEKPTESEVDRLKNEIEGLTENLADEQIKVKELNENCHGLKKEVEELKSELEAERKKEEAGRQSEILVKNSTKVLRFVCLTRGAE